MPEEPIEDLDRPQLPEESPEDQQQSEPSFGDRIQDVQDGVDQAKDYRDRLKNWRDARAQKKAGKEGLKGVEKKGVDQAKRKVATRIEGEAGKQAAKAAAGKTAAKVGASAAAKIAAGSVIPVIGNIAMAILTGLQLLWPAIKKYGKYAIYVVAALLLLLAVPFGLLGGKGSNIPPSTAAETQQATLVAWIGGDFVLSGGKITQATLDAEKKRYVIVQKNVDNDKNISGRSTEVKKAINEILMLIELVPRMPGEAKNKQTAAVIAKVQALDSSLPFGAWIADFAIAQVGRGSQNFCQKTNAESKVACASFVSTVLQNAGVSSPVQSMVDGVWANPALRLIVARQTAERPEYLQQNASKLQPGDIIFMGTGSGKVGRSKNFRHVGIYIGNGMEVDNSSRAEAIRKRELAKLAVNDLYFNGAKRYGVDL